ncbi:hypothetical protein M513_08726, partial [Trichuris suis]
CHRQCWPLVYFSVKSIRPVQRTSLSRLCWKNGLRLVDATCCPGWKPVSILMSGITSCKCIVCVCFPLCSLMPEFMEQTRF